jgi:KaiC/GvpD/RAD55 family RecA-like ATPase
MRHDTVDAFLERTGIAWDRKKSTTRERVLDCHECGKEGHLYLNRSTFLWRCMRCDASGNEYSLKRGLGLQYEVETPSGRDFEAEARARFASDLASCRPRGDIDRWCDALESREAEQARDYMQSRGIGIEALRRARIGWASEPDGAVRVRSRRRLGVQSDPAGPGWIVIPAFSRWEQDGTPDPESAAVIKLRSVPPAEKAFRRLVGGTSVLYAPCGIDPERPLLIVGGEIDALSVVVAGWQNVVATTTGESSWDDAWTEQLEGVEDLVVVYDNDEAGRNGAAKLAAKLGEHRVRIGRWPEGVKDANEALVKLGEEFDVASIVNGARCPAGDSVVRISSVRDAYLESLNANVKGASTGWDDLDAALGGVRDGEVTLVTGDTASGKSTFTAQWALQMAAQGIPTLVCPFELGVNRQIDKWVRQWAQAPPDTLSRDTIVSTLDALERLPVWLLNRYGAIKTEAMRNTISYAVKRHAVRFVLVDHLHFMVTEGPSERADLDEMMKMLAEVAVTTGVHVVVVAHPRQHQQSGEKDRDNRIIQLSDLKGSSGLKQIADNVLSVWRPRKADRTGVSVSGVGTANIYLLKVRSDYATEGSVNLRYLIGASRYEAGDPAMLDAFRQAMSSQPTDADVAADATRPRRRRVGPPTPASKNPTHWTEVNDD